MRKWLRLGLCLGLLAVALTCTALAVEGDEAYTENKNGELSYNVETGVYTASYTGATADYQYALLVVKGTEASHPISDDTIMYIDQTAANENGEVSFTFIPKSTPDCVVLLGGDFGEDGPSSPVTLGTLKARGITVDGSGDKTMAGATVELGTLEGDVFTALFTTTAQLNATGNGAEFSFSGVPEGEYALRISKPGSLPYMKKQMEINEDAGVLQTDYSIGNFGGDLNNDASINQLDLGLLISDYGAKPGDPLANSYSDINEDQSVNMFDLSTLISNFGKNAQSVSE